MEESESKRSKTDEDASERLARKRASDVDVRELDAERNQRDEDAQAESSGTKRPDAPGDDSEPSWQQLGVLTEVGARAPVEVLTLGQLTRIYYEDGRIYSATDYEPVLSALRKFGDLPSVAEVYSPPRVAAQSMTVGLRPTLEPDGTPWNTNTTGSYSRHGGERKSPCYCAAVRRVVHIPRSKHETSLG